MKSSGALMLLLSCLLAIGCTQARKDKRDARLLANRATEMSGALTEAGIPFSEQMNVWFAGEKADVPALKATLDAIAPLPSKFHSELEKMPYPENAFAVTAYRTSMLDYLKGQEELVIALKGIVEKVALSNPAEESVRRQISDEFRRLAETQKKFIDDTRLKGGRLNSYLYE